MLGQRGGDGGAWVAGEARGEVAQQGAGDFGGAATAGGELGYGQGGGGGFWAEGGVCVQAFGDESQGFAGALEREQAFEVVLGESGEVAGVVPAGDGVANPGVGVDGMAVLGEPDLDEFPAFEVLACAHQAVRRED